MVPSLSDYHTYALVKHITGTFINQRVILAVSTAMAPSSKIPCIFFSRGACKHGDSCRFNHEIDAGNHSRARPFAPVYPPFRTPDTDSNVSTQSLTDTRNMVPCKFFLQSRGCQNDSCPFLHVTQGLQVTTTKLQGFESKNDEVSSM